MMKRGGSAQKPPIGLSLVILVPIVLTMRQPPAIVPSAMVVLQSSTIQNGIWNTAIYPLLNRTIAMMPIVFCASFMAVTEAVDRRREELHSSECHICFRCRNIARQVKYYDHEDESQAEAYGRERTIKLAVLIIPFQTSTPVPPLTSPAPMSPPIRA